MDTLKYTTISRNYKYMTNGNTFCTTKFKCVIERFKMEYYYMESTLSIAA